MTKPRGVQFKHRGSPVDSRRPSSAELGDSMSESTPNGDLSRSEVIMEEKEPTEPTVPAEPSEYQKKKQSFITRTIWSLIMLFGFFVALLSGHIYILMILTGIQILSFKEVIAIAQVPTKQKNLPLTKSLNWYFLAVTMYYLYGETVVYYFKHILLVDKVLLPFATHHRFISFMLYVMGFVFFVGSLKKGHYRFQFTQFAWTHMALFIIVFQAHFTMNNVLEGMIWFFMPAALVMYVNTPHESNTKIHPAWLQQFAVMLSILCRSSLSIWLIMFVTSCNDVFAYLCGITFGRTQLIKLSPKKTVEGFVGAWICTVIFGFFATHYLIGSSYFICPVNDLGATYWTGLHCVPNPVFTPQPYQLPDWARINHTFWIAPMQFHMTIFATFASLIAPFGGFFASGLKRTFKIKDFGDSIPGHGGITDRMDCQFIMGLFAYMYYQSFVAVYKTSVGGVMELAINGLTYEEQMEVVKGLSKYLYNQDAVSEKLLQCISTELGSNTKR